MEVDEFGFRVVKSDGIIASPFESSFGDVLKFLAVLLFTFSYDQTCNIVYVAWCGCFWVFLLNSSEEKSVVDEE